MQPLKGIRVLDFSTLLPGPYATLLLAEAGAEVIKVERPGRGEDMRYYPPFCNGESVSFAMLNRGKRSLPVDLKSSEALGLLKPLLEEADVLVEQFRPGVMARLGLGYEDVNAQNPGLIYCSITGYGQTGPLASRAGHDINYQAQSGLLSLSGDSEGRPVVPPVLAADIAGGTYPAVLNILLALLERQKTGRGCHLDISMCDGLWPFLFWGQAAGAATGQWPQTGREPLTGGSPRYRIYPTSDGRFVAVAALEQKFWDLLCQTTGLPEPLRDDGRDPVATTAALEGIFAARDQAHWDKLFRENDMCCTVVQTVEEARRDGHFQARGLFGRRVMVGGRELDALAVPLDRRFLDGREVRESPTLESGKEKPPKWPLE